MKIKWEERIKHKSFWLALASAIVIFLQSIGCEFIPNNWELVVNSFLTIWVVLGVIVDSSTPGLSDRVEVLENTKQELE